MHLYEVTYRCACVFSTKDIDMTYMYMYSSCSLMQYNRHIYNVLILYMYCDSGIHVCTWIINTCMFMLFTDTHQCINKTETNTEVTYVHVHMTYDMLFINTVYTYIKVTYMYTYMYIHV